MNTNPCISSREPLSYPSQSRRPARSREWLGLALLALPTFLLGLDLTLLHLALPAMAADLQPTSTQALWIMDAYGFMIAGFLITMGTLGDRIGRRRLLLIGASVFAVVSMVAAFAPSPAILIAARALLGVAGATLMPSTLALISNLFSLPHQRSLAIGIWATVFALGMAAGPLVGGLFVEAFWWGAAFLLAVPIVCLLVFLGPVLLPEYRAPNSGRIDMLSVILSLAAILPVVYGIKETARDGVTLSSVVSTMLGLIVAAVFVRRQKSLSDPLLDMALFGSRTFSAALIVLLFGLIAVGGMMLLVAQYLQLVLGFTPFEAGLWMGPAAFAMVLAGVTAPLLARRIRPGLIVSGALTLSAVGYLALSQTGSGDDPLITVIIGLSLAYLGLGTIAALGTDLVVGAAPPEKAGSASAISETVQDLGVSLGIAILGSLSAVVYSQALSRALPAGLSESARGMVTDSLWAASSIAPDLPPAVLADAREAFSAGLTSAALVSAISTATLALIAAIALRRAPRGLEPGPAKQCLQTTTD